MASRQDILDLIVNRKQTAQCYPATVVSVSGSTVTVKAWDEMEVAGVRLLAYHQADEGFQLIPKVGSVVIVAAIDGDISNACVLQYAEIDRIESAIGDTKLKVDKDGFSFEKGSVSVEIKQNELLFSQEGAIISISGNKVSIEAGGESLKNWLDGLIQCLNTFTVMTSTGPALPAPDSIVALAQLTAKINQLLK